MNSVFHINIESVTSLIYCLSRILLLHSGRVYNHGISGRERIPRNSGKDNVENESYMNETRDRILGILRATGRKGIEDVISYLGQFLE